MRNAVAFANNDVATIAWSYGAKPEGCMGFALYRIDAQGQETALPSHADDWLNWYFDAQGNIKMI
jgi:hypothetical protein